MKILEICSNNKGMMLKKLWNKFLNMNNSKNYRNKTIYPPKEIQIKKERIASENLFIEI